MANKNFSFSSRLILSIILFMIFISYGKDTFKLKVYIKGIPENKIYLASYYGEVVTLIDSAKMAKDSSFLFHLDKNLQTGLYRIAFEKRFFDVIINNEPITLKTYFHSPVDSMQVIKSDEDSMYFEYLRIQHSFELKTNLLSQLLSRYPRDDSFYSTVVKKIKSLQLQQEKYIQNLIKKTPYTFLNRIIKSERMPQINPELSLENRKQHLINHSLDMIDFSDTLLLHSNILTRKVFAYLGLFGDRNLNKDAQQKRFMQAVDIILEKTATNERIHEFFIDYLTKGFEKLGLDNVVNYVTENYVIDNVCIDEERKNKLLKRLEHSKVLVSGNKAPEIITTDDKEKKVILSKIAAEKTLVIFWASWCLHCRRTLPKIHELYTSKKNKTFEVLAISIDTSKADWEKVLKEEQFTWINCNELEGWDSKVGQDYYLFATPTMILLDNKKDIISSPRTVKELEKEL